MGDYDGDAGQRSGMGSRREGVMDWFGANVFFMLRASDLFANGKGMFHKVYCLRRGDVAFFKGNEQLVASRIHEANKVEVRFKGSKRD